MDTFQLSEKSDKTLKAHFQVWKKNVDFSSVTSMYNYLFIVISFLSCFWTGVKQDCNSWGTFFLFCPPYVLLTGRRVVGFLFVSPRLQPLCEWLVEHLIPEIHKYPSSWILIPLSFNKESLPLQLMQSFPLPYL